jgi:pantoate--beta-alanine ligase
VQVVNDQAGLEKTRRQSAGEHPAFVPTMGALHEGHLSLIRHAAMLDGPCVVSIFVNMMQFAPDEDLDSYPRSLEADLQHAEAAGADVVFVPPVEVIYPEGEVAATKTVQGLDLPGVATQPGLEDACRPHFFGGVCLVVGRLFDLVQPASCVMGDKDYQQMLVVQAMVQDDPDRFGPLEVIGCPTVRESDGLAMSSRNAYLDDATRPRAPGIHQALEAARNSDTHEAGIIAMRSVLAEHELETEYAVIRDASTLEPHPNAEIEANRPSRALIAARLGSIRLIDNCAMGT